MKKLTVLILSVLCLFILCSCDKEQSISVSYSATEGGYHVLEKSAQIRGRGNSTWNNFPKKPYRIKFDMKQDLFGYGEAKDWVLLANYNDKSLVRNYLVYQTAKRFSALSSTTNSQPVEVYLNGEYLGVYLLCEQVEYTSTYIENSLNYLLETYVSK